jgi:23S rRNA (guanine2445-N2)-methyltransferase / 23S rRNA (guanine2069-N7)-methyltransferase
MRDRQRQRAGGPLDLGELRQRVGPHPHHRAPSAGVAIIEVPSHFQFLASAPRGFADLLARELAALGAENIRERAVGVAFSGPLASGYRACLWSRLANRVFLELAQFEASTADDFYAAARALDWSRHLGPAATLACDFSGRHPSITHTHFGALKLKDAIVDALRDRDGTRPDIELDRPRGGG